MPSKDKRPWFRMDVGYFDNPKISELLDEYPRAVILHGVCIAYAKQHGTNGRVPMRLAMRRACAMQCDLENAVQVGILHIEDNRTLVVHDYLNHQDSAEHEQMLSDKGKRAAASRWGIASGTAVGNASSMPDALPDAMQKRGEEKRVKDMVGSTDRGADRFDEFWAAMPKRGAHPNPKKPALSKWQKVTKTVDPQVLIDAASAYAKTREGLDPQHNVQAVTWLNQERWADALVEEAPSPVQRAAFVAPEFPEDAPRSLFVPWNRAHRDAWLAGNSGPSDWHDLPEAQREAS